MGNSQSSCGINYEDVQTAINSPGFIIINTLPSGDQKCLIKKTIQVNQEEIILNKKIQSSSVVEKIIVYGKNCNDPTIYEKYNQCQSLGFEVFIYTGGIFEWLLLQDIYGDEEFPTTGNELDLLKYKSSSKINTLYISN
jgi:hypothetical protein